MLAKRLSEELILRSHQSRPLAIRRAGFLLTLGAPIIAILLFPAAPAAETMVCTEPVEPVCIGMKQTFADDALMSRCRGDVRSYLKEMRAHAQCLRQKATDAEKRAADLAQKLPANTEEASDGRQRRKAGRPADGASQR